jgi:hypothetical protein
MTTFEDWHAVNKLLVTYTDLIDAARFAECAVMFEHATYRVERADGADALSYQGVDEVREFFEQTRVHADGTPRTKHVLTNVHIEAGADRARAQSYVTVFQQTEVIPLQPIASGRYLDAFEHAGGEWRFIDRLITGFLLGDRSQHIDWHAGPAPDGAI